MLQYQEAAQSAELQLEADVRAIQAYNVAVQESNQAVLQVLAGAHGPRPRRGSVVLGEMDGRPPGIRTDLDDLEPRDADGGRAGPAGLSAAGRSRGGVHAALRIPDLGRPDHYGFTDRALSRLLRGRVLRSGRWKDPGRSSRCVPATWSSPRTPGSGVLRYQAVVAIYHNPPSPPIGSRLDAGDAVRRHPHPLALEGRQGLDHGPGAQAGRRRCGPSAASRR